MERIGRRRRARRTALAASAGVVLAALAIGVGGCGGDDGGGGPSGGTPAAGGQAPAVSEALTACLEENGIEVASGGMPDQETVARIQEACGDLVPQGGGAGPPGGLDPSAIADCLREAGIDVPAGGVPSALMGAIDPSDPEVTAALQACGVGAPGS